MSRKNVIIIACILGGLGLILLIFFVFGDKKNYNWYETYKASSDQPYGTLFIKELLKSNRSDGEFAIHQKKPLHEFLKKQEYQTNTSYIFVGSSLYLTADDKTALKEFINNGNDAFISTIEVPEFVTDVYEQECGHLIILDENFTESATMNFYHPTLHDKYGFKFIYRERTVDLNYGWSTFNAAIFCDSTRNITPLGHQENDAVNFIKINYGKGALYLHCNPLVFTNYFLIKKQKAEYASAVFSHLQGKNVIWDEFGKIPLMGGDGESNNPLYFIMQQPSLKYAWWILSATILLYILFAAKRTQRVIPVLEQKTNTSLEFVKLISSLHFQNRNHLDMARKKMKYFQYFIRSKYGIHIHPFSEEMVLKISEKSKVPVNDINAIFNLHKLIEEGSGGMIEPTRLSNFYFAIENFYKHCK